MKNDSAITTKTIDSMDYVAYPEEGNSHREATATFAGCFAVVN